MAPRQGTFFAIERFQAFLDDNGPWVIIESMEMLGIIDELQ